MGFLYHQTKTGRLFKRLWQRPGNGIGKWTEHQPVPEQPNLDQPFPIHLLCLPGICCNDPPAVRLLW